MGVALNPSLLVPPDGSFRNITANVVVQDACNVGTSFTLHSITSNEPETQITVNADLGTPDTEFILGALLISGQRTRTYNVFYEGMDAQGNTAIGSGQAVVAAEGVLDVSASKLIFRHTIGSEAPAAQTISVSSIAPGSFFSIASDQPWAQAAEDGLEGDNIQVSVDPTGLAPGVHGANVTFTSEFGPTQVVRVIFYIADRPQIFTMPEELSFIHDVSLAPGGVVAQSAPQTRSMCSWAPCTRRRRSR